MFIIAPIQEPKIQEVEVFEDTNMDAAASGPEEERKIAEVVADTSVAAAAAYSTADDDLLFDVV